MRRLLMVVMTLAVAGCGASDMDLARRAVANQLKDPDSAEFRNERQATNGSVCGEVNGKNGFGAYSGYAPFLATKIPGGFEVVIDSGRSHRFASSVCGYSLAEAPRVAMDAPGVQWSVQVGSISDVEKADRLAKELSEADWQVYVSNVDGVNRIFLGPFSSRAEADQAMDQIAKQKALKGFVLRYQGRRAIQ